MSRKSIPGIEGQVELAWVRTPVPTPAKSSASAGVTGVPKTVTAVVDANGDDVMAETVSDSAPHGAQVEMDYDVAAEENEWDI